MPDTLPLAVFTALSWESDAVLVALRQLRREDKRVWRGRAGQHEVVVMTGGVGPYRTRLALERFWDTPLLAVVSVGCAGALRTELVSGQLVLAPEVRMSTVGSPSQLDRFATHPGLLGQARAEAARADIAVVDGPLLSSPRALLSSQEKAGHGRHTGAVAVEMESGAHAAFAQARALPFLPLRVILDPLGMSLPAVAGLTTPEGDIRPLKAASRLLTHPGSLPGLLALGRVRATVARTITRLCRTLLPALRVP